MDDIVWISLTVYNNHSSFDFTAPIIHLNINLIFKFFNLMSLCLSFTDQTDNLLLLFLAFARRVHPMLDCIDEVKKISDLRGPADL